MRFHIAMFAQHLVEAFDSNGNLSCCYIAAPSYNHVGSLIPSIRLDQDRRKQHTQMHVACGDQQKALRLVHSYLHTALVRLIYLA